MARVDKIVEGCASNFRSDLAAPGRIGAIGREDGNEATTSTLGLSGTTGDLPAGMLPSSLQELDDNGFFPPALRVRQLFADGKIGREGLLPSDSARYYSLEHGASTMIVAMEADAEFGLEMVPV